MFYRVIEELFAFLHISITISALIVGFVLSAQPFSRLIFQPYITSYNHIESKIDIYIDRGKGKKAIFIISTPKKTPDAYCHNDNTIKHAKTTLPTTNMPETTVLTHERSRSILTHVTMTRMNEETP